MRLTCYLIVSHTGSISVRKSRPYSGDSWPRERLYTYVNQHAVASRNPGYCFLRAGWRKCGKTQRRGLIVLEKLP